MFNRFNKGASAAVGAAVAEAAQRGDARVGTEHLLLGVLRESDPAVVRMVGVDLGAVRAALREMDGEALAAVGLDVTAVGEDLLNVEPTTARGRRSFTAAAKAALTRTVREAQRRRDRRIDTMHLLLALLDCEPRDPVCRLLARLGVDRAVVRARLSEAA